MCILRTRSRQKPLPLPLCFQTSSQGPRNYFCVKSKNGPSKYKKRRGESALSTWPLCSCTHVTLGHIKNFRPVSLNQGRYTWRHDSVLNHLYDQVKAEATGDIEIYSDLPGKGNNNSNFPEDIIVTNSFGSPGLVVLSRSTKTIAILELTFPLDRNLQKHTFTKWTRTQTLKVTLKQKVGKCT